MRARRAAAAAALASALIGFAAAQAQQAAPAPTTQATAPAADDKPVPAPGAKPFNTKCPVLTDEDVVPKHTVTWRGVNVGLCCAKCQKKFIANPQAYVA